MSTRGELDHLLRMLDSLVKLNHLEEEAKKGELMDYYKQLKEELVIDYEFQKDEFYRIYG